MTDGPWGGDKEEDSPDSQDTAPVKASHPPIKKMFMGHKHCFLNNTKACRLLRPPDCWRWRMQMYEHETEPQ